LEKETDGSSRSTISKSRFLDPRDVDADFF
jgi:hypothetical protein